MYEIDEISELSKKNQKLFNRIQGQIEYCYNCQPYDEGEPVWIHGDRTEISELLFDYNVPENLHELFARNLSCRCGTSDFYPFSEIGLKTKYEIELDRHFEFAKRKYGKPLSEFKNLIIKHPFLSLDCKIARDIKKEIEAKKLPVETVSGEFYRCRKVENDIAFETKDLMLAPIGIPKEGRFNHSGQSHLYLSKEKDTAKAEILGDTEKSRLVWIQKIDIKKPIENILDLTFDWTMMTLSTHALLIALHTGGYLSCIKDNEGNWRPDYFITRFIMDCAKKAGYNGIKYESARSYTGDNIVLFHYSAENIISEEPPVIETFVPDSNEYPILYNGDLFEDKSFGDI